MNKPFKDGAYISGSSLETLRDWIEEHGNHDALIGGEYTVRELIKNLDDILDGMWSDGISAMGDDA